MPDPHDARRLDVIQGAYGAIAQRGEASQAITSEDASSLWGYSSDEMASVPDGSNLGLGCGNPLGQAVIQSGDTVLDLGSGAGFDCFLAADRTGPDGHVIGVDITPAMIARARSNGTGYPHVEFREGSIDDLPVESESVDVVTSNCVISLVPDRREVYREAFRVLKPGGNITVSDTLVTQQLPGLPALVADPAIAEIAYLIYAGSFDDYLAMVAEVGFTDIEVQESKPIPAELAFDPTVEETLREQLGGPNAIITTAAHSMITFSFIATQP
ncbi:MAG: methyltransferase domain-containing protein [Acidimicrobiia bacterium]|nr:methyltransferase domain-containing protein [Acidimicrobiia bacterium]